MSQLIVTVGVQGAGKTTWAMREVDQYRVGTVGRVNRDQLRTMSHGGYKGCKEQEYQVTVAQNALVRTYLECGMDVVVDDTNMHGAASLDRWLEMADRFGVDLRVVDFLDVPVAECVRRNDLRLVGRIPESEIHRTWNGFRDHMSDGRGHCEDREIVDEFRAYVRSLKRVNRFTTVELMSVNWLPNVTG